MVGGALVDSNSLNNQFNEGRRLHCSVYDFNHQLAIWGINDTRITLGVLQLASVTEDRCGCAHADVI